MSLDAENGLRVVELPQSDPMAADMDAMDRDMPHLLRFRRNKAKLLRQFYVSLVDEGFTENQAMELASVELME